MNTFDLLIFVKTAQTGSLSAAARQLDTTPAVASAAIKRLEAQLGTVLFIRSTRQLRLTSEGKMYLHHCEQALQHLNEGRDLLTQGHRQIEGELHIHAPSDFGRQYIFSWLDEFQSHHPKLKLRLKLSDQVHDFYTDSIDVAIRYGQLPDSSLIATPLCLDNRRVLCASPSYIEQHGAPLTPEDLTAHNCLCFMRSNNLYYRWHYTENAIQKTVSVTGNRFSSDGETVRLWSIAGHGIAYKSYLDILNDVNMGHLQILCSNIMYEPAPLHFIYADRRLKTMAIGVLREFLQVKCNELKLKDRLNMFT